MDTYTNFCELAALADAVAEGLANISVRPESCAIANRTTELAELLARLMKEQAEKLG